jgi:hypothetical protein
MAGKGGYQKPAGPRPPSGVGKNSTRTDGNVQAIKVPNVGTSPDLQYGDRQRLEAAQRIAPIGKGGLPAAGGTQGTTGLPAGGGAGLPSWLIDMPTNRPNEPVTAGLDMGAGPGSEVLASQMPNADIREGILMALYTTYGNQDALADLQKLRQERTAQPPVPAAPMPQTTPPPA